MPPTTPPSTQDEPESLIRVGCADLPAGISRAAYFEHLDLLEVESTFWEPPGESALRRWRRETPVAEAFTLVAWQLITHEASSAGYSRLNTKLAPDARARCGAFRDTDEVRMAWARTLSAARALEAEVILFETPPAFAPSEANRAALRRFFLRAAAEAGGIRLAWEPQGLWEPAQAARLAAEIGVIYALDPLQLEVPPPDEARAYFRIHGMGIYRNKISDDLLELLADMVENYERAWVVFANVEKYPDAQRFHRLLAGRAYVDTDDD